MTNKKTTPTHRGSRPIGEKPANSGGNRAILWIAIGAAAVLIIALILVAVLNNRGSQSATEPGTTVAERIGQPIDRKTMGDPNASVLIEVYEDYQCPHCQRFNAALDDTIRDELVAPGTARYQFHNLFVINNESITVGAAAECAADQGLFWEYHDALFDAFRSNPRAYQNATLKRMAGEIGLGQDQFDLCLDTREHYEAMLREDNAGKNQGVRSTPTVFINGEQYQGDFSAEQFKAAVEAAAGS